MPTLELVTLNGIKYSDEVHEVILPTPEGQIAIFPDHMPLVSLAVPGVISVRRHKDDADSKMQHFATNGGVVEITAHRVRVLVDEADAPDEISEEEAKEALKRAKQLATEAKDQVSLDKAKQLVDTQSYRLKVAGLKRRQRH